MASNRVRVRARRRRVTVRAELGSGDPRTASYEARQAVEEALAACCLHRPPRLRVGVRVRVRSDAVWAPISTGEEFGGTGA
ncbi:DUF6286 domain-containing protein [Streptomyces sp. NPDC096030]|uniref:DUF6286 domain-containing protein n=1 Tax=Streptomyces sp. NPDC096030 TaxID=3155423 RepID=UPI00331C808E